MLTTFPLTLFARRAAQVLTRTQYELVYDATSFGMACMMAATLFFWLRVSAINGKHQSAVIISGLVTFIASYHVSCLRSAYGRFLRGCTYPDGLAHESYLFSRLV